MKANLDVQHAIFHKEALLLSVIILRFHGLYQNENL